MRPSRGVSEGQCLIEDQSVGPMCLPDDQVTGSNSKKKVAAMEWNETYSIDGGEIDREHMIIIDLINQIEEAEALQDVTENITSTLEAYVAEHFLHEEEYMESVDYPDMEEHREMHRKFSNAAVKMIDELGSSGSVAQIELKTFLQNWLQAHILDEDMKIRDWVKANK
jgi:hemerythrin